MATLTTTKNTTTLVLQKNSVSTENINKIVQSNLSTNKNTNGEASSLLTYAAKFKSYDMTVPTNQKIVPETYSMNACFPGTKNISVTPPIYVLQFPGTSFGLIFFFPNSNDVKSCDEFRLGFGEVDSTYDIGWKFYKTNISDAYKQALTTWAMTLPNNVSNTSTSSSVSAKSKTVSSDISKMTKNLTFSIIGSSTGDRATKIFSVGFNFTPGATPTTPPSATSL